MSWQQLARALPFGGKRKVRCCGTSPSTYVHNSTRGIGIGPCFRCGARAFERHEGVSFKQLQKWRAADDTVRGMQRPPATTPPSEWPTDVLVWLGKAGVRTDRAAALGAGWAPSIDRFILPCLVDGVRTGAFTARSLSQDKTRPKYLQGGGASGGLPAWIGGTGPAVFVEDTLSAWRVSWAGFRGAAILGKSVSQEALRLALRGAPYAVSWFDPDAGGREAHVHLRKSLGLWDVPLYRVQSERDPKLHSREEIQRYIKEASRNGH